ncbi:unnamed protein product, partial [Ixodes persulcatus]
QEAQSPTPRCPGLGPIPVPSLTPETPTWPVVGRRYLSDSLDFTPLEETRQITFVDISITPEAGDPSLPDSRFASLYTACSSPWVCFHTALGSKRTATMSKCSVLSSMSVKIGLCACLYSLELGLPQRATSLPAVDGKFSQCRYTKSHSVRSPKVNPAESSSKLAGLARGGSYQSTILRIVPKTTENVCKTFLQTWHFVRWCSLIRGLSELHSKPALVLLQEPPAMPSSTPFELPFKTLAEATFSKPDNGSEALCDSGNMDVAVALDGTFSVSFTTPEVAPQLPATEACENSAAEDVGAPVESGATFMESPASAVDRPKLEPTRAAAPARLRNSSFTVSHDAVGAVLGPSHRNEAVCEAGGTEVEAGCLAARGCQDGFAEEADPEEERRISFPVPSASAAEELKHGGPARGDVGTALVGAGRVCGTAVSDATFIESLEARGTVAGRPVADEKAFAPPLGPQQSQLVGEDVGTVPVVADELGDAVVSDATFTEPPKASGIVASRPATDAKAGAASGVPAPPLGPQRSLPAPRLTTKPQPGKGQPAGVVPAKRGTGIPGRQSLLPTGGATKTAGRG